MKIWFDTEFIEDGKTIDLISLGAVSEDGTSFYAHSSEYDVSKASPWVRENVLPHVADLAPVSRARIAADFLKFCGGKPEFWAYFADYDWVALCQLYGTMMDLPSGWPMYCRDVKQLCDQLGNPQLPAQLSTEHNALADAHWTKEAHEYLLRSKF